ncbi:hypothetical protein ACS0TY_019413 [Phlomoides rotata]
MTIMSTVTIKRTAAQKLVQFLTHFGRLMSTEDPTTTTELQDLLEAKDQAPNKATSDLTIITSENDQLMAEVANLKRELDHQNRIMISLNKI